MKKLFIALLLVGCATSQPTPGPGVWKYDDIAKDMLERHGQELLKFEPKDFAEWCPVPKEKLSFYNALLAAMSTRESGQDPDQEYKENFKNRYGEYIISTGLLQVSYSSCGSYGVKTTTEGLKDPATNLECAVRILNQWIPRDGYVAKDQLGCGRYWSVCRPTSSSKEYIKAKMREYCK